MMYITQVKGSKDFKNRYRKIGKKKSNVKNVSFSWNLEGFDASQGHSQQKEGWSVWRQSVAETSPMPFP